MRKIKPKLARFTMKGHRRMYSIFINHIDLRNNIIDIFSLIDRIREPFILVLNLNVNKICWSSKFFKWKLFMKLADQIINMSRRKSSYQYVINIDKCIKCYTLVVIDKKECSYLLEVKLKWNMIDEDSHIKLLETI